MIALVVAVLWALKPLPTVASGNFTSADNSNFRVLRGDVELSQRAELISLAAFQNAVVNVNGEKQTAVVVEGINIQLDWSRWVAERLSELPTGNATFTLLVTPLNDSGYIVGPAEEITEPSQEPGDRLTVVLDEDNDEFFVEVACVMVADGNGSMSDSAVYQLEACAPLAYGGENEQQCYTSNITLYAVERPNPLEIDCVIQGISGRTIVSCMSSNRLASRTCTIQDTQVSRLVPCRDLRSDITLSSFDHPPGSYNLTINSTDVYGQTASTRIDIAIIAPRLSGSCREGRSRLNIVCQTTQDRHMTSLTFNCSYDNGLPEPCGSSFNIDKEIFTAGDHELEVTFISQDGQTFSTSLTFNIGFELTCSAVGRPLTITCEANDVIDTSLCAYEENDPPSGTMGESCELPLTVDFTRYDHESGAGFQYITITVNSTTGASAVYTHELLLGQIECAQLTEPGVTTLVCATRPVFVRIGCSFPPSPNLRHVPCDDISYIVLSAVDYPVHVGRTDFFISGDYPNEPNPARSLFSIDISVERMVQCSDTLNCSANSTLMSARECCVDSKEGLSYVIPGRRECHPCIVFGWIQDAYFGLGNELTHTVQAGYLKGAEQAGVDITMKVARTGQTENMSNFIIENETVQMSFTEGPASVVVTFIPNESDQKFNESLELGLQLVALPSTIHTMPIGEGVFFMNRMLLTVMDAGEGTRPLNAGLIGGVIGAVCFVLLIGGVITAFGIYFFVRRQRKKKMQIEQMNLSLGKAFDARVDERELTVQSSFKLDLAPHLIIPSSSIKLNETIGQGEFGIVYRGYIIKSNRQSFDEYLAIKTLKGFYDHTMVSDMLKECSRMSKFKHPNVLTLRGVCLDGGPAPFIVMPFMANGSLLAYLKRNRKVLTILPEADMDEVETVRKQLLDMCIQIAKGMEYLASMKVVHRDLAARNCMIDCNFVIKVADFGLSESIGAKEYFRQDVDSPVKLPLRWLPPESITDYVFSEKSDVWAYGVTCWEIFTGGKAPYSAMDVREIPKQLLHGYRLERPENEACNDEVHAIMQQCWCAEPDQRPTFSQLVNSLSSMLEGMAGYIQVSAFDREKSEL